MLYYDRIYVSEGIDVNKTNALKECDMCHYCYFLNKGFKFQPYICNRCHDLLIMAMKLSNIAILNIKGSDYYCIISEISKSEAIKLLFFIIMIFFFYKHKCYIKLNFKIIFTMCHYNRDQRTFCVDINCCLSNLKIFRTNFI